MSLKARRPERATAQHSVAHAFDRAHLPVVNAEIGRIRAHHKLVLALRHGEHRKIVVVRERYAAWIFLLHRAAFENHAHGPWDELCADLAHDEKGLAICLVREETSGQEIDRWIVARHRRTGRVNDHVVRSVVRRVGLHHGTDATCGDFHVRPSFERFPADRVYAILNDLPEDGLRLGEIAQIRATDGHPVRRRTAYRVRLHVQRHHRRRSGQRI